MHALLRRRRRRTRCAARGAPRRRRARTPGPARKMLAARRRVRLGCTRRARRRVRRARAARRSRAATCSSGQRPALDRAIRPLVLADREEAVERVGAALRRGAPPRLAASTLAGVHLWHGFTQYLARRPRARPRTRCARAADELQPWGFGATARSYCGAFLAAALLDARRRRRARARRWTSDRDPARRSPTARASGVTRRMAAAARRGPLRGGARGTAELRARAPATTATRADAPWRSLRRGALDRLGPRRARRIARRARRSSSSRGAWGAPGTVGRALRALGRLERRRRASRDLEEAVALLERLARRGSSTPRRWPRSAPRCGARGARPTRASRCAARSSWPTPAARPPLAEEVRAELYAAGARPRTDALAGVEALTADERRVADLAGRRRDATATSRRRST